MDFASRCGRGCRRRHHCKTSSQKSRATSAFHGPTTVFGQVEGGYSIPALARVGIGARFISGDVKAYGTVALPIAPAVHIKGDAGDGYYALGLTLGF